MKLNWPQTDWTASWHPSIQLSVLGVTDSSTWPPTLSLPIRSRVCLRPKQFGPSVNDQPLPPLDSLLKSKWDKKIHMFQRVLWQILTPTFFSWWWKSVLARVTLLLQPLSLKGTRFRLMPFSLCQVTWIFQLKSISVLCALCVSVLTDTPPEAWGHSVRRCSSVLSLWCLMNVEGNSRCCFSSPDDEVHWTFWGFFRLPNAQGPSCCCSLEEEFALWALRACEWLAVKRNDFVAYMLREVHEWL